jgi:hypothetical protein
MFYIAHRGLINGPDKSLENLPEHILSVLDKYYHCEVDVWRIKNEWFTGHDEPVYKVDESFIGKNGLWLHCKNLDALYELSIRPFHYEYFWHQEDDFTMTSGGYIWTYPGKHLTNNSIAVLPESCDNYWSYVKSLTLHGVCTKYVEKFISETSTMHVGTTEELQKSLPFYQD